MEVVEEFYYSRLLGREAEDRGTGKTLREEITTIRKRRRLPGGRKGDAHLGRRQAQDGQRTPGVMERVAQMQMALSLGPGFATL